MNAALRNADDVEPATVAPPTDWNGFEEKEHYWEVFDPYEHTEPVCGSLSDDLLDVYCDLKRGLDLWDGSQQQAAIWEWRFHFDIHWDDHAIDALRALHRACKTSLLEQLAASESALSD